jgi:hypothetical protein
LYRSGWVNHSEPWREITVGQGAQSGAVNLGLKRISTCSRMATRVTADWSQRNLPGAETQTARTFGRSV